MRIGNLLKIAGAISFLGLLSPSFSISSPLPQPTPDRLVVHEWGTFTALQDEHGRAIGGINTDDEPVPAFVHNLHGMLLQSDSEIPPVFFKGYPRCARDVMVRLETPVIYFHLPPGVSSAKLDVDVSFNGGWLTQFYPDAKAQAPGLQSERFEFGPLNDRTVGSLSWHNLTVGTHRPGPTTSDKVWTAPRRVDSAAVTTPAGESEQFLFYRGVGHIKAPLQVSRSSAGDKFEIRADWGKLAHHDDAITMGPLWLVDVRADGTSAVRTLDSITATPGEPDKIAGEIAASFSASDYAADNLARIRASLHAALVRDGLYDDEADGLLNTWEVSYFKRPGLRLFFMVPTVWTNAMLPLHVSQSANISRAMVGRIELVTPRQRDLLRQISAGPASKPDWVDGAMKKLQGREDWYREDSFAPSKDGHRSLLNSNVPIPADYRAYLSLGRFRNALLLDEAERNPSSGLDSFVSNYSLEGSRTK